MHNQYRDPVVALMIAAQEARSIRITPDSVGQVFTAVQLDYADADGQLPVGTVLLIGEDSDAWAVQNRGRWWSETANDACPGSLSDGYGYDATFRLVWLATL